jgi:GNAT superfamily N-acetyltransferase
MMRQGLAADHAAVLTVVAAAFGPYTGAIGRPAAPLTRNYRHAIEAGQTYVAEESGKVVGVAVVEFLAGDLLLEVLAVSPDHQGGGIGGALLQFVEHLGMAENCQCIRLYTNVVMVGSINFYAGCGYVEAERAESDGYRRVHLQKVLGAVRWNSME